MSDRKESAQINLHATDSGSISIEDIVLGDKIQHIITISAESQEEFEKLPPIDIPSPYKGLTHYKEEDAALFYGRDTVAGMLADRITDSRFFALIGASGSGKSSLVQAGVMPLLRKRDWSLRLMTPSTDPINQLAYVAHQEREPFYRSLCSDSNALGDALDRERAKEGCSRLLLVVDQFEELFTKGATDAEKDTFLTQLLTASASRHPIHILIVLRADFYGHCSQHSAFGEAVSTHQLLVGKMKTAGLLDAIIRPAAQKGGQIQQGLPEQILADIGNEPGRLPLLSHALDQTWQRRRGHVMTLSGYLEAGGIKRAIAQTADTVYDNLSKDEQQLTKRLFLALTELGEGAEDTRRRVNYESLLEEVGQGENADNILQKLAHQDRRLITITDARVADGVADGTRMVEVAHEALIREWGKLRKWLDDNREALRTQRTISADADAWIAHQEDAAFLYRGVKLQNGRAWLEDNREIASEKQTHFIERSQQYEVEEEQAELEQARALAEANLKVAEEADLRARRTRMALVIVGGLFLIASLLGVFANDARIEANASRISADNARATSEIDKSQAIYAKGTAEAEQQNTLARSLSTASQSIAQTQSHQAWLLAIESLRIKPTSDGYSAIYEQDALQPINLINHGGSFALSIWNHNETKILTYGRVESPAQVWSMNDNSLLFSLSTGHSLSHAVWKKDGTEILTYSRGVNNSIDIWSGIDGRLLISLVHEGDLQSATWNKDETKILTTNTDGEVRIWSAKNGSLLFEFTSPDGPVKNYEWNQDGTKVILISYGGKVFIQSSINGEHLFSLDHTDEIYGAIWNEDESKILTYSADGTVKVWTNYGTLIFQLTLGDQVWQANWNQNETEILTISKDGTASIWSAENGSLIHSFIPINSHEKTMRGKWNEAGTQVLAHDLDGLDGLDGTVWVWSVEGRLLFSLPHGGFSLYRADWNDNGSQILTAGDNNTAKVWSADTGVLLYTLPHDGFVIDAKWNTSETKILTTGNDGISKVWSFANGDLLPSLNHDGIVVKADWNINESDILTIEIPIGENLGSNWIAKVWSARDGHLRYTLAHDMSSVRGAKWNADGSEILTYSDTGLSGVNGTAKVWSARDGVPLYTLYHEGSINDAIWSRDESKILTFSNDGMVKVWSTRDGSLKYTFAHDNPVINAEWDENEEHVLTVSDNRDRSNGKVTIWSTANEIPPSTLVTESSILEATWLQNGDQILTYSSDGIRMIWSKQGILSSRMEHQEEIIGTVLNNDETKILTYDSGGLIKIWNANNGSLLLSFSVEQDYIDRVVWRKSGTEILVIKDNLIEVWSLEDRTLRFTLSHEDPPVIADPSWSLKAHWNADETMIMTYGGSIAYGIIRIWQAEDGTLLTSLNHEFRVRDATLNKDETRLLISTHYSASRYYIQAEDIIEAACERTTRNLSISEWQQYFPNESYRKTCDDLPIHPTVPRSEG